jgi:hypothetical protein
MGVRRVILAGLVTSAAIVTGTGVSTATPATLSISSTTQPLSARAPNLNSLAVVGAAQGAPFDGAATPYSLAAQFMGSDESASLPTKSPAGQQATLPDPTTSEESRANEVSAAVAAIVSEMPGFGGIWVDEKGITHVAMQQGKAGNVKAALGDRFNGEYLAEEVKFAYADLVSRRDSISKQLDSLETQGLDLLEWGPDEKNNTVWISLRNYSAEKADLARKVLGEDTIVKEATVPGDENDLFSRTDDYAPYSGGIYLGRANDPYPRCTSGMPILINGGRYLVSAAHCYDSAFGGQFPSDVYNGGAKIGRANWADFTQYGTDAAVITAPASFTLFRTETSFTSIDKVHWNSLVGQTVCAGGAFSGEKCALPVIAVNYCSSYYQTRITCGVSTAGKDGAEAAGHGDSGGPMYILSPYKRVSGIIVAAASPQFTCSRRGPVPPGSVRTCSSYIRFQTASSILSHWGTTM